MELSGSQGKMIQEKTWSQILFVTLSLVCLFFRFVDKSASMLWVLNPDTNKNNVLFYKICTPTKYCLN
jgi:hypothetical protein